jgi:hypothetical protein
VGSNPIARSNIFDHFRFIPLPGLKTFPLSITVPTEIASVFYFGLP